MVTLPVDVHDISTVVKFCAANRLSPSIKSGGFATAGWAIQGEVVIDTSLMDDVKLVVPKHAPTDAAAALLDQHSSPLTVPAAGPTASYDPSGLVANDYDTASASASSSQSFSQQVAAASNIPPAPVSAASAAIDPITATSSANSITIQSESVSAADELVKRQIHSHRPFRSRTKPPCQLWPRASRPKTSNPRMPSRMHSSERPASLTKHS